jgi:hypothetical protein
MRRLRVASISALYVALGGASAPACMRALLKKKPAQFAIAVGIALLGPFLLPPHVVGVYTPLGSTIFEGAIWRGEPDKFFYGAFFIELTIYSCVAYGVIRFNVWLCGGRISNAKNISHVRKTSPAPPDLISAAIVKEGKTNAERANEMLAALVKSPDDGQNR